MIDPGQSLPIDGYVYGVHRDGRVFRAERRGGERRGGERQYLTRSELLELDVDGPEWEWLRARGLRRPSPSGTSVAEADRAGARVRLDEEATKNADALGERWTCTRAEAIAHALRMALHLPR